VRRLLFGLVPMVLLLPAGSASADHTAIRGGPLLGTPIIVDQTGDVIGVLPPGAVFLDHPDALFFHLPPPPPPALVDLTGDVIVVPHPDFFPPQEVQVQHQSQRQSQSQSQADDFFVAPFVVSHQVQHQRQGQSQSQFQHDPFFGGQFQHQSQSQRQSQSQFGASFGGQFQSQSQGQSQHQSQGRFGGVVIFALP
jgi:hypothetical protein